VVNCVAIEYYVLIGTKRIRVLRPNMRVKNGVVHIIEEVVFDPEDPRTGLSTSRAGPSVHSLSAVALCFTAMLVCFWRVIPQL